MDIERVRKILSDLTESLRVAESIVAMGFEEFASDIRNRYTLRLALVEVVEAATSLGLHILREDLGVRTVESYAQVFRKLVEHRVISPSTGSAMERLARLRNIIIHRYWDVDDSRIYREAKEGGLDVIKKFIEEVESYVARARGG